MQQFQATVAWMENMPCPSPPGLAPCFPNWPIYLIPAPHIPAAASASISSHSLESPLFGTGGHCDCPSQRSGRGHLGLEKNKWLAGSSPNPEYRERSPCQGEVPQRCATDSPQSPYRGQTGSQRMWVLVLSGMTKCSGKVSCED